MSIGRISGPLLKANLLREGVNLAFETDLLYLDVNNMRIGVNTTTPTHDLQVNGTTKTTYLETDSLKVGNITISGNTIDSDTGVLNLSGFNGSGIVYQNKLKVDFCLQFDHRRHHGSPGHLRPAAGHLLADGGQPVRL